MKLFSKKSATAAAPATAGVSREDVVAAYRMILGREPENERVIREAQGYESSEQLRQAFLDSEEFRRLSTPMVMRHRFPHDLNPGGHPIEVNCEPQAMAELLAHVEKTWSRLGEENPYWSVITHEDFELPNFEKNQEAFWQSGKVDFDRLQRWLERNHIKLPPHASCLEYGCGTGRVTRWLSQGYESVIACDISESHLQLARQAIPPKLVDRVKFQRVNHLSALEELPGYDLLFTIIVLQHNPPPVIAYILDKLLARLRPGGVAYFQVPTFHPDYRFTLRDYLKEARRRPSGMEMHILPQQEIFRIAARHHCEPIEVNPDHLTASLDYISTTFLLRKTPELGR